MRSRRRTAGGAHPGRGRFRWPLLAGLGLVVLWSGLAVGSAHAQDRVQFEVMVAQAFDREGSIDPSCQELSKRLPMRYGTIRMVRHRNFDLDLGKAATVQLPSGRLLSFLPIQVINRRLHLQYRMSNVVNTRLQLVSGKPVILGGEPFDGGFLIVQLTPSFAAPETHSVEAPPADLPRVKRVNARD